MSEKTPNGHGAAPHVVVIGAGFGGLEAAKQLSRALVQVTVVDKVNYHLFQPLLYQVALAGLGATDIAVPIRSILRGRNVQVLLGKVEEIDPHRRRVRLAEGDEIAYDYLVVAAGARTNYYGHDEWARLAPGLKDLDDALEIRRRVLLAFEAAERTTDPAERRRLLTFVVIGGGPTGVELAGALADLSRDILAADFARLDPENVRVVLLEVADRILTAFEPPLAERAVDQLRELRVEVRTKVRIERIEKRGVWIEGKLFESGTVLWGAGVTPSPLARQLDAPLDRAGRVIVETDCSVPGHRDIFVVGDMAAFIPPGGDKPLPGISPVAIQQGRAVARNIAREIEGGPRQPFEYLDKGFMATIGRARAVAVIGRIKLWGFVAWLAWVFVHLWYLVGFRNRIVVFLNWIWSYAMFRYGARVIMGPAQIGELLQRSAPPPEPPAAAPPQPSISSAPQNT